MYLDGISNCTTMTRKYPGHYAITWYIFARILNADQPNQITILCGETIILPR